MHRATGLWIWLILAMLAFTGVAMNLSTEVFRPAVEIFSNFSQWPESNYIPQGDPEDKFKVTIDTAIKVADEYLEKEGISAKLGAIGFNHGKGTYGIRYHSSADLMDQHPDTQIFVSGQTAKCLVGVFLAMGQPVILSRNGSILYTPERHSGWLGVC